MGRGVTISTETLDALTIEGLRDMRDVLVRSMQSSGRKCKGDDVHLRNLTDEAEILAAINRVLEYMGAA